MRDSAAPRTGPPGASSAKPAEFVETVPFTQTREYIQIVLRNADIYRQLYAAPETALQKPPAPANRVSYSNGIDQRTKKFSRHRRTLRAARASAATGPPDSTKVSSAR